MPVSLDLASIQARLAQTEIDVEYDAENDVLVSGWQFSGGGAHVLIYVEEDPLGRVLRLHAVSAEPAPEEGRPEVWQALSERSLESYGEALLSLSWFMDDEGVVCWAWSGPFPEGLALEEEFFDDLFDTFVVQVRDDVNAMAFALRGGFQLTDSGRRVDSSAGFVGDARYVHDRTGAILEIRCTAEAYEELPERIVEVEQLTSLPGVEIITDTSR